MFNLKTKLPGKQNMGEIIFWVSSDTGSTYLSGDEEI